MRLPSPLVVALAVLADPSLPVRDVEASVDAGNLAYSRIIIVGLAWQHRWGVGL
jgi:hypothetical protein